MKAKIDYDDTHYRDWRYTLVDDQSNCYEIGQLDGDRTMHRILDQCDGEIEVDLCGHKCLPGADHPKGWTALIEAHNAGVEKPKPKRRRKKAAEE